jgi:hypothetical protein
MADTKGTRRHIIPLTKEEQIHVFSTNEDLYLQLRRKAEGEEQIREPSFKVAVRLSPIDALDLAAELMSIATVQLRKRG